jgi:hypothetical protein
MPTNTSESVTNCTAPALPFWPPCPLCRAAEAVPTQPRPPPAASAWGGAVARRRTQLYGISISLYVV